MDKFLSKNKEYDNLKNKISILSADIDNKKILLENHKRNNKIIHKELINLQKDYNNL